MKERQISDIKNKEKEIFCLIISNSQKKLRTFVPKIQCKPHAESPLEAEAQPESAWSPGTHAVHAPREREGVGKY